VKWAAAIGPLSAACHLGSADTRQTTPNLGYDAPCPEHLGRGQIPLGEGTTIGQPSPETAAQAVAPCALVARLVRCCCMANRPFPVCPRGFACAPVTNPLPESCCMLYAVLSASCDARCCADAMTRCHGVLCCATTEAAGSSVAAPSAAAAAECPCWCWYTQGLLEYTSGSPM
jgi:hypothetical protein